MVPKKKLKHAGQFQKGQGGRPVGATNVVNRTVKETLLEVFNKMQQGPNSLENWGEKEPTEFYRMASKLIPTEITGNIKKTILVTRKKQDGD